MQEGAMIVIGEGTTKCAWCAALIQAIPTLSFFSTHDAYTSRSNRIHFPLRFPILNDSLHISHSTIYKSSIVYKGLCLTRHSPVSSHLYSWCRIGKLYPSPSISLIYSLFLAVTSGPRVLYTIGSTSVDDIKAPWNAEYFCSHTLYRDMDTLKSSNSSIICI